MKCDLHRHMGGSIRASTVACLLEQQIDISALKVAMQFSEGEEPGFQAFMRKFEPLYSINWTEQDIITCIQQIVWDIAAEKIDYAEIHFSIDKYLKSLSWTPDQVIRFIYDEYEKESDRWGIKIGLVLSLIYNSDRDLQKEISKVIEGAHDCVVGLDLVGDEEYFDVDFYKSIFKEWKSAGKGLVAHVGESQTAQNVRSAIVDLGVDRVAHGIRIVDEDRSILEIAKDHGVCFDIALSSNVLTGVVSPDLSKHPVREMMEAGCAITIGTDDPVQCDTTLDKEYQKLITALDMSEEQVLDIINNSILYAFDKEIKVQ